MEYKFNTPLDRDRIYDLLREAAQAAKSDLHLSVELVCRYDHQSGGERVWADDAGGIFSKPKTGQEISFSLESIVEPLLFTEIKFSSFDIQEFGNKGKLRKYVNTLVNAIKKADRKIC